MSIAFLRALGSLVLLLLLLGPTARGQDTPAFVPNDTTHFTLFQTSDGALDLKIIDPAKGNFGFDYKINLRRELIPWNASNSGFQKALSLAIDATGFITTSGSQNPVNSLITEVKLSGDPLLFVRPGAVPTDDWRNHIDELPDSDYEVSALARHAQATATAISSPLWVYVDAHARHETTQSFDSHDVAAGLRASLTSSYLNTVLDFIPRLLRAGANNNPRQLDLSLAYDYVYLKNSNLTEVKYSPTDTKKDYTNRLNFRAEWQTGILTPRDRLGFYFDSYYDLQPTSRQEAVDKDRTYFYAISLTHRLAPVKSKATPKIILKYTRGGLPPDFTQGYVLGGGFSVDF